MLIDVRTENQINLKVYYNSILSRANCCMQKLKLNLNKAKCIKRYVKHVASSSPALDRINIR